MSTLDEAQLAPKPPLPKRDSRETHVFHVTVSKGHSKPEVRKATVRTVHGKDHALKTALGHYEDQGYKVHDHKQVKESYDDNRTGFVKKKREDDEYHNEPKPKFKAKSTMDRPHTVHVDGKPWKKFDNGHQAHAAANTLKAKGKKAVAIAHFKEHVEESVTTDYNLIKGQSSNKAPTKKLATNDSATKKTQKEEVELEEGIQIHPDRYIRSHGKKPSGGHGLWMFTHKHSGGVNYSDKSQVHSAQGNYSDAKKSAAKWAAEHGHKKVYVMEGSNAYEKSEKHNEEAVQQDKRTEESIMNEEFKVGHRVIATSGEAAGHTGVITKTHGDGHHEVHFGLYGKMDMHKDHLRRDTAGMKYEKPVKEELEHIEEESQKHVVHVTVSDPHHTMVSKRKETVQRRAVVTAKSPEHAVDSAIAHYKRAGYKVHDHNYVGLKEGFSLDRGPKDYKVHVTHKDKDGKTGTAVHHIKNVKIRNAAGYIAMDRHREMMKKKGVDVHHMSAHIVEEVAANSVAADGVAGFKGDAGKKVKMTKEPLKRKTLAQFREECNCWKGYKRKPGTKPCEKGSCVKEDSNLEEAAIDAKGHKSSTGGLTQKGVDAYNRENPGHHLQTAVTTPPSKLDPDSKAAKRRKSFCARMSGVEGPMKDEKGRPTRKALALRKWNC